MASTLTQNFFTKPLNNPKILNPARPATHFLSTRSISASSLDKKYKSRLSLNINNAHVKSSSYDYNNNFNNNNNGFNGQQYEYEQGLMDNGPVYPRPTEIQWKKELCNCVQLIGNVGNAVELKQLSSGKVVASCRLAVRKSATDTTWINLTFWDEMAHIASRHVEKGNQIYVSGRLVADTVDSDDGKQQTYYKVVVQQLNFVEKTPLPPASNDGGFNYNSNSSPTTGRKQNYNANTTGSIEELWQAYFANPDEWWDNRKNKKSPKHPDFKHKDTGEALWVEGRYNPSWVESQLSVLDSRRESFHNQNANMRSSSMFGDNLTPY
uniref:protein OSB2, chloroplastic-like n=1 Tax=Erigeron canadensis TaxID=72917 RepID=UPI001CB8A18B|nr:protein OSB2, chloroplastic-like [Erigeron canadensis]